MIVNELIAELNWQAREGRGGLPVVDENDNTITGIEFNDDAGAAIVLVT